MAYEKEPEKEPKKEPTQPRRSRRALGLIIASTVATAPSLGCSSTAAPTDASAESAPMDGAVPMDTAVAMDGTTADAADDGDDAYPAGIRG